MNEEIKSPGVIACEEMCKLDSPEDNTPIETHASIGCSRRFGKKRVAYVRCNHPGCGREVLMTNKKGWKENIYREVYGAESRVFCSFHRSIVDAGNRTDAERIVRSVRTLATGYVLHIKTDSKVERGRIIRAARKLSVTVRTCDKELYLIAE